MVAEVTIVNGDTSIPASQIRDVRNFITAPVAADDVTIEVSGSTGKLQVKAGSLGSTQVGSLFGGWVVKAMNTSYLAATDGFVVCRGTESGNLIQGYTDAVNPPTTLVVGESVYAGGSTGQTSATFPVKKGHYWKVTGSTGYIIVRWLPIGS